MFKELPNVRQHVQTVFSVWQMGVWGVGDGVRVVRLREGGYDFMVGGGGEGRAAECEWCLKDSCCDFSPPHVRDSRGGHRLLYWQESPVARYCNYIVAACVASPLML
jgi:hypothetical protein